MKRKSSESDPDRPATSGVTGIPNQPSTTTAASMAHEKSQSKRMGKRPGRKPSKIDQRAKLERSRQSARECRARKKLRYQYLEELVVSREKAVFSLRDEVEMYKRWSVDLDRGIIPESLLKLLEQQEAMQKPLTVQSSPPSHSSTPTASPSSVDTDHMTGHPGAHSSSARLYAGASPTQLLGQQQQQLGQQSGQLSQGHLLQQHQQQHQGDEGRRQPLTRQPHVSQQISSINRGCRSFEESSRSSSSTFPSAMAAAAGSSSSVYRSGSVPNLTVASAQHGAYPAPASSSSSSSSSPTSSSNATLVFKDFQEESSTNLTSTGFLPDLTMLSRVMGETDAAVASNIPTVVSHQSPPAAGISRPGAAWTWDSPGQLDVREGSQARTYPYTCVGSVMHTPRSAQPTSQRARGDGFCSTKSVSSSSPVPNFLAGGSRSSSSAAAAVSAGSVPSSAAAVPFYQRPRSSSDLAPHSRVPSSAVPSPASSLSSSSSSLSQQNLPGLFEAPVATFGAQSQGVYRTLAESVTTCLASSSLLQGTPPVCMGSELSASISEPLPHWYSFLDDLENVAFSSRQGAFSNAGTPGTPGTPSSLQTRSGAGTPSSVDSPYSQQQLMQQGGGSDGNIPNIISDLLGHPPSS